MKPGCLCSLINDKELRTKMGKEGRKCVEDYFVSEVMVKNTEDLYKELLGAEIE